MIEPLAHGLGGRSDLPVPLWMALYGGGAAVIASFFALAAFWSTPRLKGSQGGRPLPEALQRLADSSVTRAALRTFGLLLFACTVAAAALGPNSSARNPAPTWIYVWFWVGLVPASMLLGPIWRLMNPLRAITAGLARLAGDPGYELAPPIPDRIGYWPAALSLLAFVCLELVYEHSADPQTVLVFIGLYSLIHISLANKYGPTWYAQGDGFEVYSTFVGSLAPLGRRADGRLVFRNPFDGLMAISTKPGFVAVISTLLGSTAFDGLTRTGFWIDLTEGSVGLENALLGSLGLGASIGFVALTYTTAARMSGRLAGAGDSTGLEVSFAHSLIPIAIGYTIAHYFSLLMFQGQFGYILASDPFGRGWDLFGTLDWTINYLVVSTTTIAWVQVGAIVLGHIAGVIAAHDRAVGLFPERGKTRGQFPLLAVMVTYTMGGIALLVGT